VPFDPEVPLEPLMPDVPLDPDVPEVPDDPDVPEVPDDPAGPCIPLETVIVSSNWLLLGATVTELSAWVSIIVLLISFGSSVTTIVTHPSSLIMTLSDAINYLVTSGDIENKPFKTLLTVLSPET